MSAMRTSFPIILICEENQGYLPYFFPILKYSMMYSGSRGRPADIDPSVKQCKLKFTSKTWSAKWTETLAIKVCDYSVSSCFTLLRWEEESCWSAIRTWGRLAVEVSSNSEGLSCTFSPGSKKGKETQVTTHTCTHTPWVAAATKHSLHRAEVTDLTDTVKHTLIHTSNTFYTLSSQTSPQ